MSHPDPEPTPEQEARVRRLLAEARPDPRTDPRDTLPPHVAERLDATLRELSAPDPATLDPATAPASGRVVPLTARRRRRVAGGLLAAAAVVVAAVGVGQVVDLGGGSSGGDNSTAAVDSGEGAQRGAVGGSTESGAESGAEGEAEGGGESTTDDGLDQLSPDPLSGPPSLDAPDDQSAPSAALEAVVEVRVRVRQFSDDAARVRAALGSTPPRNQYAAPAPRLLPAELRTRRVFECGSTDLGAGIWVGVVYAGSPGVLVFRRPMGDAQVADLVQCGTGDILRSTTLPVRPRR